jgi:hypothetical protein
MFDETERCPSRLRFDRLLAGELEAAQAQQLEQHARCCPRCRPLLDQLRRGHAAFPTALPDNIAQRVREHEHAGRDRPWLAWSTPALAAAALLLALAAWPARPQPDSVRTKGGPRLSFYILHDGAVRPGTDGERVQPGDRLEFAYSSERDAFLAIVSIDAARKASAYYEQDGRAARIGASSRAVLDRSTLLDGTLGPETIYALVCAEPIAVTPLLQALERAPARVPDATGCSVQRYALVKVPR